jgi:invasion protein IalB
MIGSMDRWSAGHMGRSVLLAAFAVGLATTPAIAQQGQAVPKTAPKSVTKAAPDPGALGGPAAAPAGVAQGGANEWVKVCRTDESTSNKQVCLVNHEGLDPNSGIVVVAAGVRTVDGENKQHLLVNVTTAYTLIVSAGVQIRIDENEPIPLQFAVCLPTSCQAQMELTKDMLDKMRTGKQLVVAALNTQQKTMAFGVSLVGFNQASDGAPVDNAKYQEARRQMLEQSRQRQIELANRAAESQLQNRQSADQPQPAGTSAQSGPNSTIAQPQRPPAPAPQ